MLDAITATQLAMQQDQLHLQSVSQNVSNIHTPGYKRQILENNGFDQLLQADMTTASQLMTQHLQSTQGTFTQSKRSSDLALSGEGYFEVQTDTGILYTRRGDFQINAAGELTTPSGARLLGKNGVIRVDDHAFTVDASGTVLIDNQKVDQISVVQFKHPHALKLTNHGLYESLESPCPLNNPPRIMQGYLEQSNVKSMDEMMEMVKTSRHFEASQHVMRAADGLLSNAIQRLGTVNE